MTTNWDDEDEDEGPDLGPGQADYDLSEEHGYMWEPSRRDWPVPPFVLALVSLLLVAALVLPTLLLILRRG